MAVILEIVDATGARTRHRLETLPLTVGRAMSNDLILDDPYVDARHARFVRDESGALRIEDLGSVNGLVANNARLRGGMPVEPGAEVRVGRTTLRFRDPDETLPPALLDTLSVVPADGGADRVEPAGTGRLSAVGQWLATTPGRLTITAFAACVFAVYSWSGSVERSGAGDAFAGALGFALLAALWAGVWAVASRVGVQRFHFVGHLAVASMLGLAGLVWTMGTEWMAFLFPDSDLLNVLSTGVSLVLFASLIALPLSLSSTMPRRRRWRAGGVAALTVLAIVALASLAADDTFSDVPTFSGIVKPVPGGWVPTRSVDQFSVVIHELKADVDELAEKPSVASAAEADSGR